MSESWSSVATNPAITHVSALDGSGVVTKAEAISLFGNRLNCLTGSSNSTSFDTYFQPSSADAKTWVFRSDDARKSFLSHTNTTATVGEDDDSEPEDEVVDEFAVVDASAAFAAVCEALADGAIGDAAVTKVSSILKDVPSREAAAVVMRALMKHLMTLNTLNKPAEWVAPTQYGKLIASYCYGDAKWREALVGLSEIQRVWATTGKAAGLLLSIFVQLHQQDAMEDRGFVAWKNNCTFTVAIPGKSEAVAQLSAWFDWLVESDDEEESDEESETSGSEASDSDDEDEVRRIAARGMADATITWQRALKSKGVQTLEDPLLGTPVDKSTYQNIYGPFLETLDGGDMTSYFDFFFESQPSCPTHWAFKDEEVREDFRDCCRDLKCLPSMRAAQEGEDEDDKAIRKAKEREDEAKAAADRLASKAAARHQADEDDLFDRTEGYGDGDFADGKDEATLAAEDAELARQEAEEEAREAKKRQDKQRSIDKQREKLGEKKKTTVLVANARKEQQMRDSLEELRRKLEAPGVSESEKAKLLAKAEKIVSMLESTV